MSGISASREQETGWFGRVANKTFWCFELRSTILGIIAFHNRMKYKSTLEGYRLSNWWWLNIIFSRLYDGSPRLALEKRISLYRCTSPDLMMYSQRFV